MQSPLLISRQLLTVLGTRMFFHHQDRIPRASPMLVVSNHRSFMDAPLLMAATDHSIRFACHHYMGQVPILRDFVNRLGCFPLDAPSQGQQRFFHQATHLLQTRQVVGIFPEGAQPMIQPTSPQEIGEFHRGFAHLALRAPIEDLTVLPVAIVPQTETISSHFPLKLLSWFDPSEPLFKQDKLHPMIIYQRVNILIGHPIWITSSQRQSYQGKQAKTVVADLITHCQAEIKDLLCYGS